MPHHAVAGDLPRRARQSLAALVAWHDSRPRASFATARGWMWATLVAATVFWMSNPVILIPSFYLSLGQALIWTKVALVLDLPRLRLPRLAWPWLVFLALGLLSQLWTINDFHTDVSNTVYLELTALAVIVAANCRLEVVCWGLALGGAAVVGLSLYTYQMEVPGSLNVYYGGIAGVGSNENILAYTVAVALAAALAIGLPRHRGARAAWLLVLAVHAYGLYRANSGTGYLSALTLMAAAVSIIAWPALRQARRHVALVWAAAVAFLLATGLLAVLVVLGKQLSTLSGRAPFWRAAIESTLHEAPFLGSGWGAVWEHPWDPTPPNEVANDIYVRAGYPLPHGHNFFVDVLPELGLVGVLVAVLMVAYAIREIRRCGLHAGAASPMAGRLILLVLVALLVSGITEPMLTVPLGWWSLALVVALSRQRVPGIGVSGRRTRTSGRRVAR